MLVGQSLILVIKLDPKKFSLGAVGTVRIVNP